MPGAPESVPTPEDWTATPTSEEQTIPDQVIADLQILDAALMRLRRLWTTPRAAHGMRASLSEDLQLSTVLVVDALAREPDDQRIALGVADIAERIDVAPSTASRLVERAVAAGMVERCTPSTDARRAELHLTDAGQALHERACRFRAGYLGRVLADWRPSAIAELAGKLDAFAEAVAHAPGEDADATGEVVDNPRSPMPHRPLSPQE